MQISLLSIGIYNFIDIALISYFGMRLIVKAFDNFAMEKDLKKSEKEHKRYGTFEIFVENLNQVRKHFWASFYILEVALIAYFVFWGILFYNNAVII